MTALYRRQNRSARSLLALLLCLFLGACAATAGKDGKATKALPPLPSATALKFSDFYQMPVGPKGLEPTEKLLSLNGKTVRIQGYMVREEQPLPGLFMLAPTPVDLAELADGPADYLPPATLFVHLSPEIADKFVGFRPGTWTLVGRLELGGRPEANGRVSYVRLSLDDPASARTPDNRIPELQDGNALVHHHPH